ncbi:MAG: hypothetical protein ACP5XB_16685 [Isosphaeraceae bacterium]
MTTLKRSDPCRKSPARLARPVSWLGLSLLAGLILAAPAILFFDPLGLPGRGHITREPLAIYSLYSDDFAYVAASRNLSRALANLFVPHNTHIVPAWRLLTWALVAWSGTLEKLPEVLAEASYAILVAVMLLTGRLVARETGRASLGLAAMVGVGVTSLMASPACWYSAGQTLWAGFGILATLWYAQCWRRSRSIVALPMAAVWAMLAGWFWTIGHLAGPVAAVYLWLDGRRRCRWAAAVPLFATVAAVTLSLILGGSKIDSTVSFHGRTTREAARPISGILHTAQAIPENLILANLGLRAHTTELQGLVLTAMILGLWASRRLRQGGWRAFNPLECTGVALVLGAYLVEWTVRGYLPFQSLRTINLGMIVPWYDVIPQMGAVLFVVGWFSRPRLVERKASVREPITPPSRLAAIGIIGLLLLMNVLNRPRVDLLWRNWVPALLPIERQREMFPILSLQTMRASVLLLDRADWQRRHLRRLDQAQKVARRLGIGREAIHSALGRLDMPLLPDVYDALGLLDLPEQGSVTNPDQVRRALEPFLFKEPEPRPFWLPPTEPWPPPDQPHWSESDVDTSE